MQDNQNNIPEEDIENATITLTDEESGEELEFVLIAEATIEDKLYYALMPKEDIDEGEEYVILRVSGEGDDQILETVDDDDEFEKVEDYFNDLLFNEIDYDV